MGCKLGDGGDPETEVLRKGMGPHWRSQILDAEGTTRWGRRRGS